MGKRAAVEVEGARELRKAFTAMGDEAVSDLKAVNLEAAEIVAAAARPLVPKQTGKLESTVRAAAAKTRGSVKAGFKKVPYAGAVHFGWPARNISPQPFLYDAIDRRRDEVVQGYVDNVTNLRKKHGL